jgi:hypothetical protein
MANQHTSEWSNEIIERMLNLAKIHKLPKVTEMINKEFGTDFTYSGLRTKYMRVKDNWEPSGDPVEEAEYRERIEIQSDGTQISDKLVEMTEKQMKDPEYILLAHGYDPKLWKIINVKISRWHYRDKTIKNPKISYATQLKVKPKEYELSYEEIKADIQDLLKDYKPKTFKPLRHSTNGKLLEVNISDLHLNKLGYIDGEYDHDEAERRFFHVIEDVLTETIGVHFEKILFIWSHDFFNIDNLNKTTTAGTPQDVSQRFSDMYKQGKRMLIQGIDYLKQIAPVETVQVGANHDRLTSYTMSEVLEAWYKDDDNVIIDTDPLHRKYRRWGKCLIGFSHGDKEKKRLGKIMPIEARKDWGETLFCEIHAAHIHTEQAVKEENGVIVRYLSPLSGTDTWHYESGYVGSLVKAQSFIWDKELGVKTIIQSPITRANVCS